MKRALERRLADLAGFAEPQAALEQYATPADLAAHVVHLADLQGDLDRPVVDLGTGTGVLALACALRTDERVVGLDRDPEALAVARENERRLDAATDVDWVLGDATRPPLDVAREWSATVVMNPPFGAHRGNRHRDRAFLETASDLAGVSYSVHNEGSRGFLESFAADNGGAVTHAFAAELALPRQFAHHTADSRDQPVEVVRIDWAAATPGDD